MSPSSAVAKLGDARFVLASRLGVFTVVDVWDDWAPNWSRPRSIEAYQMYVYYKQCIMTSSSPSVRGIVVQPREMARDQASGGPGQRCPQPVGCLVCSIPCVVLLPCCRQKTPRCCGVMPFAPHILQRPYVLQPLLLLLLLQSLQLIRWCLPAARP